MIGAVSGAFTAFGLIFLAALLVIGFFVGKKRGWLLATIRFGTIIVSLVVALIVTNAVSSSMMGAIEGVMGEAMGSVTEQLPVEGVTELGLAIGLAITAPFIFVIMYILVDIVLHIIYSIVTHILHDKIVDEDKKQPWIGAAVGAVSSLFVFWFLMSPLSGTLGVVGANIDYLVDIVPGMESTEEDVELGDVSGSLSIFPYNMVDAVGGGLIYDATAVIRYEGRSVSLRGELSNILSVAGPLVDVIEGFEKFDDETYASTVAVAEGVERSLILRTLGSRIFAEIGREAATEGELLDQPLPSFSVYADGFITAFFHILSETKEEYIKDDILMLADLLKVFSDNGVLTRLDSNNTTGNESELIISLVSGLKTAIAKHERYLPLNDEINRISLMAMAAAVDTSVIESIPDDTYDAVAEELNRIDLGGIVGEGGTVNTDSLKNQVNGLLEEAGVSEEMDSEMVESIVDLASDAILSDPDIVEILTGEGDVTGEDIKNLLNKYREQLENGGVFN